MVDEAVRAAKVAAVADAVRRVREVLPPRAEGLAEDRTTREIIVLNVFVAVQECLSLASHWLADRGRRVPSSYGEVFLALADDGAIDHDLARRLGSAAGFRNLIAHQYGAIDFRRVHEIASRDLDDLLEFCRRVATESRG
jgi:uncharacterized protein YutE (UPF0331/DUF86 family)